MYIELQVIVKKDRNTWKSDQRILRSIEFEIGEYVDLTYGNLLEALAQSAVVEYRQKPPEFKQEEE